MVAPFCALSILTMFLDKRQTKSFEDMNSLIKAILATATNLRELLIKETLLIHKNNPSIILDESSTPLHLFNTYKLNVIS